MTPPSAEIVAFWENVGPAGWYRQSDALDDEIRTRFLDMWEAERDKALNWALEPRDWLARLILLDQFPRNMFRGSSLSFATDARALSIAKAALDRNLALRIDGPMRQFFLLPFEHAENVAEQHRAVRLFLLLHPEDENMLHARAHRAVIRRFGRFPHRNQALDRVSTPDEVAWMEAGGYGAEVERLKAAA